ncbi:hypothetical protein PHYPSEUDO_009114 [Phytophthora pseudosyringae]|uniref:Uncharacterized protein n=1 Tax=Phytophthora pseudosyringae TaxID=221518 RepID=A0A8T1VFW7_9STRA|nr:hypothetical protein PHYPSEUDO_009114 [Phytophthora pseudosyringae]
MKDDTATDRGVQGSKAPAQLTEDSTAEPGGGSAASAATDGEQGAARALRGRGRHKDQYEVEYCMAPDAPLQPKWLGIKEYEDLLDDGKLENELGGDGE